MIEAILVAFSRAWGVACGTFNAFVMAVVIAFGGRLVQSLRPTRSPPGAWSEIPVLKA
jgi:hypothetical protein